MKDTDIGSKSSDYGTLVWWDDRIAGWESLNGQFHKRWYYPFDSFDDIWAANPGG